MVTRRENPSEAALLDVIRQPKKNGAGKEKKSKSVDDSLSHNNELFNFFVTLFGY